jgi:hypothetical protein
VTDSPSTEPSPSFDPSPEPETPTLQDGRHFGYIKSIDMGSRKLEFDLAYFLIGDEANQAAAEHGDETPVPNDYYIVNDNPLLRTIKVPRDVSVLVIDWGNCCKLVPGEIQPFADAFSSQDHKFDEKYQGADSQYWITVQNGVVVRIQEQYLP